MDYELDLKEEIYKCSKCAQCKSVCPIYLATKNEMFLARGRYIVLNGFFNNNFELSPEFIKNLDVCLNCNACTNFCPSSIDAKKIFTTLKNKYNKNIIPFSLKLKIYFNLLRTLGFLYRLFPFKSLLKGTFADKIFSVRVSRKHTSFEKKQSIAYFEGCVNKYINPSDKNASLNLLEKFGYKTEKIISLCCGYPLVNEGNFTGFEKHAQRIVKSIPKDVEYIVCSCDSCYETLKTIKEIAPKLKRLDELIGNNIAGTKNDIYFKPMLRNAAFNLPVNTQNAQKKGICSTYENFFALKYPEIADKIIQTTFYKKDEIENKTIFTTCQITLLGLIYSCNKIKSNTPVMSYAEYVLRKL